MRFKNKITGSVLEPSSEFVIEQMKKSEIFEEVKENKTKKNTQKK